MKTRKGQICPQSHRNDNNKLDKLDSVQKQPLGLHQTRSIKRKLESPNVNALKRLLVGETTIKQITHGRRQSTFKEPKSALNRRNSPKTSTVVEKTLKSVRESITEKISEDGFKEPNTVISKRITRNRASIAIDDPKIHTLAKPKILADIDYISNRRTSKKTESDITEPDKIIAKSRNKKKTYIGAETVDEFKKPKAIVQTQTLPDMVQPTSLLKVETNPDLQRKITRSSRSNIGAVQVIQKTIEETEKPTQPTQENLSETDVFTSEYDSKFIETELLNITPDETMEIGNILIPQPKTDPLKIPYSKKTKKLTHSAPLIKAVSLDSIPPKKKIKTNNDSIEQSNRYPLVLKKLIKIKSSVVGSKIETSKRKKFNQIKNLEQKPKKEIIVSKTAQKNTSTVNESSEINEINEIDKIIKKSKITTTKSIDKQDKKRLMNKPNFILSPSKKMVDKSTSSKVTSPLEKAKPKMIKSSTYKSNATSKSPVKIPTSHTLAETSPNRKVISPLQKCMTKMINLPITVTNTTSKTPVKMSATSPRSYSSMSLSPNSPPNTNAVIPTIPQAIIRPNCFPATKILNKDPEVKEPIKVSGDFLSVFKKTVEESRLKDAQSFLSPVRKKRSFISEFVKKQLETNAYRLVNTIPKEYNYSNRVPYIPPTNIKSISDIGSRIIHVTSRTDSTSDKVHINSVYDEYPGTSIPNINQYASTTSTLNTSVNSQSTIECIYCFQKFKSTAWYKKHIDSMHSDIQMLDKGISEENKLRLLWDDLNVAQTLINQLNKSPDKATKKLSTLFMQTDKMIRNVSDHRKKMMETVSNTSQKINSDFKLYLEKQLSIFSENCNLLDVVQRAITEKKFEIISAQNNISKIIEIFDIHNEQVTSQEQCDKESLASYNSLPEQEEYEDYMFDKSFSDFSKDDFDLKDDDVKNVDEEIKNADDDVNETQKISENSEEGMEVDEIFEMIDVVDDESDACSTSNENDLIELIEVVEDQDDDNHNDQDDDEQDDNKQDHNNLDDEYQTYDDYDDDQDTNDKIDHENLENETENYQIDKNLEKKTENYQIDQENVEKKTKHPPIKCYKRSGNFILDDDLNNQKEHTVDNSKNVTSIKYYGRKTNVKFDHNERLVTNTENITSIDLNKTNNKFKLDHNPIVQYDHDEQSKCNADTFTSIDHYETNINEKLDDSEDDDHRLQHNERIPNINITSSEQFICDASRNDEQSSGLTKKSIQFLQLPPHIQQLIKEPIQSSIDNFTCNICDATFSERLSLGPHYLHEHIQQKSKECPKCKYSCATTIELTKHIRLHTGYRPFKCLYAPCQRKFITSGGLFEHIRYYHDKQHNQYYSGHICKICEKEFNGYYDMKRHEYLHKLFDNPEIFGIQCELCPQKLEGNDQLKQHLISHLGTRPFRCSMCVWTFATSGQRVLHEKVHKIKLKYSL